MDNKARDAAQTIMKALPSPKGAFTIADVSAKSGLALRDAEVGLQYLTSEYRGHLAATERGELLYNFPTGFSKPWETTEAIERAWARIKKGLLGAAKLIVRAWISIVMIAYVVIFAAILIAISMTSKSDRDRGSNTGNALVGVLFRLVADSLFWTFHPFSPFYVGYNRPNYRRVRDEVPFYEKVNRYFFGPEDPPEDPGQRSKQMVALIRAKRGRIGITDVMRVTGLAPHEADPLLAKLMLDYDGDVSVSEEGSLVYTFKDIRKTVQNDYVAEPPAIWSTRRKLKPLTGNPANSNFLITMLNGFNLMMSLVAISQGWTLEKLQFIFTVVQRAPHVAGMIPVPPEGTPLLLGWIPFWFSLVLFLLPIVRWFQKPREKAKVDRENGRRGILFAVLNKLTPRGLTEQTLKSAWEQAAQSKADDKTLVHEVVKLGGDIEYGPNGEALYRFKQIENEVATLGKERKVAPDAEQDVGRVIFSSAN